MLTPAESDQLRVVLVSTRNPLNIGSVARAMSNFGIPRLRLVNPFDEAFREARSAVGASEILKSAEQFNSVADAIADCSLVVGTTVGRSRELKHELISLPKAAPEIRKHLAAGRAALLFGSEKRGLSNSDFAHCHWLLSIPTREDHPSMNLAQSVAICLYEIAREVASRAKTKSDAPAKSIQLEHLNEILFDLLTDSGYVKPKSGDSSQEKLRRLVRRLHLNDSDAELLLGMLRKIAWKLGSNSTK